MWWQLELKAPADTPGRLVPPQRLRHNSRKRAEGAMRSISLHMEHDAAAPAAHPRRSAQTAGAGFKTAVHPGAFCPSGPTGRPVRGSEWQ